MGKNLKVGIAGAVIVAVTAVLLLVSFQKNRNEAGFQPEKKGVYTLRFGHNITEDSAMHLAAVKFASLVQERSSGRLMVEIFPNQALGNDNQMVEMARAGELDIVLTPTAKLSTLAPAMQYADLPFLFPDRDDAYALLDGEVGSLLLAQLPAHGLIGATFWENGFKQFTANRPIHGPEDFTGLNIRVMQSQMILDQFKAFGANPVPIDFHQTHQALKDGVVDGQENPLVAIHNMRFHEVQSHLILSNHAYLCYVLSFSKKVYEQLPQDLQGILFSTARELTAFERTETQAREKTFLENIQKSGTEIITLSEAEIARFREATAHISEKYRDVIGEDILAKTEQYLNEQHPQRKQEGFIVGLNADLSLASSQTGLAIKRGMEMAVEEINLAGGIFGKPVRILAMDHAGIAARARQNIKKFGAIPNLLAVVGGQRSPVMLANLALIHEQKMVYLVPWASASEIVKNDHRPNYLFRIAAQDEIAGPVLLKNGLAISPHIGFLLENTAWGGSVRKELSAFLAARGMKPCAVESFDKEQDTMLPQLQRMVQAGARVIVLAAENQEVSTVARDLAKLSSRVSLLLLGGNIGADLEKRWGQNGAPMDVRYVQTFSAAVNMSKKKKEFMERYQSRYHATLLKHDAMVDAAAHSYDLICLLATGVKNSENLAPESIVRALERIPRHEGVVKLYSPPFTEQRHEALSEEDLGVTLFKQ
ncbi:MAG: DctP family TRAP transporter solute-binding subunit [Desulfobulbaceae bacterium]|nr:DctP family TRAP transporter solute-binding subunit [Desulfobulbaceae bacterium]HIJ89499.1 DctP family TRAP transporter solute-binding subunit [Deltaproteobacteria bacterium]